MNQGKKRRKLTRIMCLHYIKLILRSALFLGALSLYAANKVLGREEIFCGVEDMPLILSLIWLFFVVDMLLRFFPSRFESMGCQKQFACNCKPTGKQPESIRFTPIKAVIISWTALNGAIGAAFLAGWIDEGILLLISMAYAVCDMICILFFCPFQTWMMGNRCCTTCRIYNWDYAMMFTPFLFIPRFYTWSLLALALLLLIRWEVTIRKHPERFSEVTNCSLSCANCEEKLCQHKKQLRQFIKKNAARLKREAEGMR
ncbi:MAG: hypothetical protein IKU34_04060 [Clostridia bacterium]|nr:hypothetical protein [Clostridia bacterium]